MKWFPLIYAHILKYKYWINIMIQLIDIAKKVRFSWKLKKKDNFGFFFHLQSWEGSYNSHLVMVSTVIFFNT